MQGIFFAANDDRVTGVIAAVELHDIVDAVGDQVCGFAFALIAPLGSDNYNGGHPESFGQAGSTSTVYRRRCSAH